VGRGIRQETIYREASPIFREPVILIQELNKDEKTIRHEKKRSDFVGRQMLIEVEDWDSQNSGRKFGRARGGTNTETWKL